MRIIAGRWRGKKIEAPAGAGTRPTSDRAREMIFNVLMSLFLKAGKRWENMTFADVFAGSGAVGIEALSRGAREVICLENGREARACLARNIAGLVGIRNIGDAMTVPAHDPVDVLFMDAPYGQGLWQQAAGALSAQGWIGDETLIIVEMDREKPEKLLENWEEIRACSAGRNLFKLAKRKRRS